MTDTLEDRVLVAARAVVEWATHDPETGTYTVHAQLIDALRKSLEDAP